MEKEWKIEFRQSINNYIGPVLYDVSIKEYPFSTSKLATHIVIDNIKYTINVIVDNFDEKIRTITLNKY